MTVACNRHCDDQDEDAHDTELAKLGPAKYLEQRKLGQREESDSEANDVSSMCHSTVPSIASIQLSSRRNVQEKVAEGSLKCV